MSKTAGFYAPNKANIERLQAILTEQSGTDVAFEVAEEVGIQLVALYECLARERNSTEETGDEHTQ